jgi:hypothetical protein
MSHVACASAVRCPPPTVLGWCWLPAPHPPLCQGPFSLKTRTMDRTPLPPFLLSVLTGRWFSSPRLYSTAARARAKTFPSPTLRSLRHRREVRPCGVLPYDLWADTDNPMTSMSPTAPCRHRRGASLVSLSTFRFLNRVPYPPVMI